jgi:hypothetical protein
MLEWKRWTATAAVGGALLLGGLGVAVSQEAEAPGLDVDELATRMQLDDEARADLEQIAQLMERQMEAREQMRQLHGEMAGAMSSLHERLTPEQRQELHGAMYETMHDGAAMMRGQMGMGMRGHMGMRSGMGMMRMHGGMGPAMHSRSAGHHHAACPWTPDASEDAGESSGS